MAIDLSTDWRIMDQMDYLKGETLKRSKYVAFQEGCDHDHCAFCSEKMDASTTGLVYCTVDYYHWICETCYADFKEAFEWELESGDS